MPKVKTFRPSLREKYRMLRTPLKDNRISKYSDSAPCLEDVLRNAIREERDLYRAPYRLSINYDFYIPDEQYKLTKVYYNDEDVISIRDLLKEDDAKFRNTRLARRFPRIRVPSLKRSDKEWLNFYRTWPWLAVKVALGQERFIDGAKLKYIPLFKTILDKEWPENLQRWTEEEYDKLVTEGKIN